jgi:glucokinase
VWTIALFQNDEEDDEEEDDDEEDDEEDEKTECTCCSSCIATPQTRANSVALFCAVLGTTASPLVVNMISRGRL